MALDAFSLLQIAAKLTCRVVMPESYFPGAVADASRVIRINGWDYTESLTPDSSLVPVALLSKEYTIAGGEAVIDLTAAPILGAESGGAPAADEDLTGKNLIAMMFSTIDLEAPNAAPIVIKPHATNGYDLFGADGSDKGLIALPDDSIVVHKVKSGGRAAVAGADKIIHLTGTDGDVLRVMLVFEL